MDTSCFLNTSYNGQLLGWHFENFEQKGKCCLLPSQIVNENFCTPLSNQSDPIAASFGRIKNCPEGEMFFFGSGRLFKFLCIYLLGQYCFTPDVKYPEIIIKAFTDTGDISLSLGHPYLFYYSVQVSSYKLRFDFLAQFVPSSLPNIIHNFLWYAFHIIELFILK